MLGTTATHGRSDPPAIADRRALVFSGGGIFFATHVGVMDEMARWTVRGTPWLDRFDVLVGTSAGAVYAALYASGLAPATITFCARIFADPHMGPQLFDPNLPGFGAALVRHDPRYALGAVRGHAIQNLLETVFSRQMHAYLKDLDPTSASEAAVRQHLQSAWNERRSRPRDAAYYRDQLTFADCVTPLFLIGVNASNGQKTVFAARAAQGNWQAEEAEDDAMYQATSPDYFNAPARGELALLTADPTREFRRLENRIYRGYDTTLYGAQLPLALAVRASLSIPVIFEPLRLRRWHKPDAQRREEDVFIDGGVDDNFSLSVAVDPHLGNAGQVLGIALGNLGYRIPDRAATTSIVALLNRTTAYMGDALVDLGNTSSRLTAHQITVIDALAGVRGQLTDTNRIGDLVADGVTIAQAFWRDLHPGTPYPGGVIDVDPATVFVGTPEKIYLSAAARGEGAAAPALPEPLDVQIRLREVFSVPLAALDLEWRVAYAVVALGALGALSILYVLVEAVSLALAGEAFRAITGLGASLLVGLFAIVLGVLLVRLLAYALWRAGTSADRRIAIVGVRDLPAPAPR